MKRILFIALLWVFALPVQAFSLQPVPPLPAPPLILPLATGGYVDLAKLRGRVVLVNFWASWCPPCLMEMPSMDRLAKVMGKYPFVLLAVNAGESPGWVRGVLKQIQPGYPVGLDEDRRNMQAWGGMVMPTSYLVDKAGRIRYRVVGPMEWDTPEMIGIISSLMRE